MNSSTTPVREFKHLFGRDDLFKKLSRVVRQSSIHIRGERRFGKTSILRCLEQNLKNKGTVVLYIDWKSIDVQSDRGFHAEILLVLMKEVIQNGFIEEIKFGDKEYKKEDFYFENSLEIRNVLLENDDAVLKKKFREILHELIVFEIQVICLFDEYEFLFRNILDNQSSFYLIRSYTEHALDSGKPALSYIVAGNTMVSDFMDSIGSPELNTIAMTLYVGSLEKDGFKKLCSRLFDCDQEAQWIEEFYNDVGGVAFFAKAFNISGYNYKKDSIEKFRHEIVAHLASIHGNLKRSERGLIDKWIGKRISVSTRPLLNDLIDRGILVIDDKNVLRHGIGMFELYYNNQKNNDEDRNDEINELRDDIRDKIHRINEKVERVFGEDEMFFVIGNEDVKLLDTLRKKIYSRDTLENFASAVYKVLFERTKLKRAGYRKNKSTLAALDKYTNLERDGLIGLEYLRELRNINSHLQSNYTRRTDLTEDDMKLFFEVESLQVPSVKEYLSIQRKSLEVLCEILRNIESGIKKPK